MSTGDAPWQGLSVTAYHQWRQEGRQHSLIDVREDWEVAHAAITGHQHIPMAKIPANLETLRGMLRPLVIYCHAGIRSAQVASFLCQNGLDQVYNLHGGIEAWSCKIDASIPRY